MNTQMFEHEAVRRNLDTRARGVRFVDPGEGYLAWVITGRYEPKRLCGRRGDSASTRSAPCQCWSPPLTYEDVDPARYIGNRSSGRMGYAIAAG